MRLAAYTDYTYHRLDGEIYGDRAFAVFLARIRQHVERLVIIGRLEPGASRARYPIGDAEFIELPYYRSLAEPASVIRAIPGAISRYWRALDDVDAVWLFGPHPLAIPFALLARLRRRTVILGVRQDLPRLIAARHPRRFDLRLFANVLEGAFRLLARAFPVVVVGPDIERRYRRSRAVLPIAVSLVTTDDLVDPQVVSERQYAGPLTLLSVGRLDAEKNPAILADVLARLRAAGADWSLVVCGEGPLRSALEKRATELGLDDFMDLRGYVPLRPELLELYRSSHALLHISWTEGLPQVLIEATASGLPIVATDVGGVGEALAGAAVLVPPNDPEAAATAVETIARDADLRESLISAGRDFAGEHTLDTELAAVARFIDAHV